MKKITLLFILIAGIFAVKAKSQFTVSNQESGLNSEQKMPPFALGMSLEVLSARHNDSFLEVISKLQSGVRYYSAELKPVVD